MCVMVAAFTVTVEGTEVPMSVVMSNEDELGNDSPLVLMTQTMVANEDKDARDLSVMVSIFAFNWAAEHALPVVESVSSQIPTSPLGSSPVSSAVVVASG